MSQWINYHHLFYFKTIAEEQSVSKAASRLRLGQPTLSAQLKQLENSMGVQLFDRQKNRLVITEQGKIALEYARNIFKMGSEMFEVLHDRHAPSRISLHIGAIDSIAKQVILSLSEHALSIAPCQITLLEGDSDALIRELINHKIDILLLDYVPTAKKVRGLTHRLITRKMVSLYASPKYRKLKKGFPESIVGQPLIAPTYGNKLRHDLEHWAHTNGITLNILVEGQDIAVKKLMAVAGLGLIPAARHTVASQIECGELIEIGSLNGVYEELSLVAAQRKFQNPIASSLLKSFSI